MSIINCPGCGHLKVFHHGVEKKVMSKEGSSYCSKESLSGCHVTIESDKDKFLECDCKELY
jgi:transcription elongation factor Elf1